MIHPFSRGIVRPAVPQLDAALQDRHLGMPIQQLDVPLDNAIEAEALAQRVEEARGTA